MKGTINKIEKLTAKSGKIWYKVDVNNETLICFDKAVEGLEGKSIEYEIKEKEENGKVSKFLHNVKIVEEAVPETKPQKELDEHFKSMVLSYAKDLTCELIPLHKLELGDTVTTVLVIYEKLLQILEGD